MCMVNNRGNVEWINLDRTKYLNVSCMTIQNVCNSSMPLHYDLQLYYTVKCYQHRNPMIENILLRFLIFLKHGFAFLLTSSQSEFGQRNICPKLSKIPALSGSDLPSSQ